MRIGLRNQASKQTEGSRGSGFRTPSDFPLEYLPLRGTQCLLTYAQNLVHSKSDYTSDLSSNKHRASTGQLEKPQREGVRDIRLRFALLRLLGVRVRETGQLRVN